MRPLFLLPVLWTCVLPAQDFQSRLVAAEATLARHYRGESLDAARERCNQSIEAFNVRGKAIQAEMTAAKERMEQERKPGLDAFARLQSLDQEVRNLPPGLDQDEIRKRTEARNVFAREVNALNEKGQVAVTAYNARVVKLQQEQEETRVKVLADQEQVKARFTAHEAFARNGQDLAFSVGLARLSGELREALRRSPESAELQAGLAKARALRRELAQWAVAEQARQVGGLVVVEARLGDEPVWLILDTGASEVTINPESLEAAGLGAIQGGATHLTAVGGLKVEGRACVLPDLTVNGHRLANVAASAVRASQVGLDGLLGQTFLKAFVYTVDERRPEKIVLIPR